MIVRTNGLSLGKVKEIEKTVREMEVLCTQRGQDVDLEALMEYLIKEASESE